MFGKIITLFVLGGTVLTATILPDKDDKKKTAEPVKKAPSGILGTGLPDTSRYFLFPIKPGKPNFLSGTICRAAAQSLSWRHRYQD